MAAEKGTVHNRFLMQQFQWESEQYNRSIVKHCSVSVQPCWGLWIATVACVCGYLWVYGVTLTRLLSHLCETMSIIDGSFSSFCSLFLCSPPSLHPCNQLHLSSSRTKNGFICDYIYFLHIWLWQVFSSSCLPTKLKTVIFREMFACNIFTC